MDGGSTATAEFFGQLGRRGHRPVLPLDGTTIRFDMRDEHGASRWLVMIKDGDVRVPREANPEDASCAAAPPRDPRELVTRRRGRR